MKTLTLSALFFALAIMSNHANGPNVASSYTFIKKDKDISLSCRELQLPDNRKTREIRAEFRVKANVSTIFEVITAEKYAIHWMKGVKEFSNLSMAKQNDWYAYIRYQMPWPLNDQDCIIRYRINKNESQKRYVLHLDGIPDYIPQKPGIERISHLCGSWTICSVSDEGCSVVYTIYSAQKAKYPRWVTDPVIQNNLINTMAAMREISETTKH